MKLHPLQRAIIRAIEPIPTGVSELVTPSPLEQGQVRMEEVVTGMLRSLHSEKPMVWDPWIVKDDDVYRLFYLQGVEGNVPWWTFSRIYGAISKDLEHWQDLGLILDLQPDMPWESGRICAGCAYKEGDTLYLFYSAGGKEMPYLHNEAIGVATSTDGRHWQRHCDHYPLIPDEQNPWYGRCNWTGHFHWRDPYIFKDPKSDRYYMFICASSKTPGNFQGCVGVAVADQIAGPYHILPPALVTSPETAHDWAYYHMERPQVFYRYGKYHLFFSCFTVLMNPQWIDGKRSHRVTNSSLYWYVSDHVTGPYSPVDPDNFIVPGSERTGLYGTAFLQASPSSDELIAYGWYHRLYTLEVGPTFRAVWTGATQLTLQKW